METQKINLGKHFWALTVSFITLLVGGWLMVAPYALGYQPYGGNWVDQTKNDFWTGLAVVIFSLVSLLLFAVSLVAELRTASVIQARPKPEPVSEAESVPVTAPVEEDFERAMAKLAAVLAADLAEKHQKEGEQQAATETFKESNARS